MSKRDLAVLALLAGACQGGGPVRVPIFIEGRAVAPAGDSLFGVVATGGPLLLLRASGVADSLGLGALREPVTVQHRDGDWWVSDVQDGVSTIVRLRRGAAPRVTSLGVDAVRPHQFAVLPDGALVYEVRDHRLVVRRGDSVATFAAVEVADRPSFTVAAGGGVLHAVPGLHITLYNAFGNLRWRLAWPWVATAHVGALAIDPQSRIQLLSGVADLGTFIVYTIDPTSGEVTRWSQPDSSATFVVDRLGGVVPDRDGRWRR
ncbi:MAG: hypothetical protein WD934_03385 [Gemmatimonadales bacterium]